MSKPRTLPEHTRRMIDRLDDSTLKHVAVDPDRPGGIKKPRLRVLLDRAERALLSARSVSAAADGFPTTTPMNGSPGGGRGAGRTIRIVEEAGPALADVDRDTTGSTPIAVTSVEAVVLARSYGQRLRDPVGDLTAEIEGYLRTIDTTVERLAGALERFDRLRSTAELVEAPQCYVAAVVHRLPFDPDWGESKGRPLIATTFVGVLEQPFDEERKVCRWVYDFTRAHRRLPTGDEMRQKLERGHVRVQTGEITTGRAS